MADPGCMPGGKSPPISPVHLDGRTLEGGGQLMRNALALSALTGRAVTVSHIRGNRKGKTGLKASHTAAVKFLAEISGSKVDGDRVGSQSVTFSPRTREVTPCQKNDRLLMSLNDVSIQPEYNIRLSTPGSVFLIFQALYPYLLHVGSRAGLECIKVTITGGTNGTDSPSYDYAAQVMAPNFARLGLPPLAIVLHKRGWSAGLAGMGSISFFIHPLALPATEVYEVNDTGLSTQGAKIDTEAAEICFPRINIMDHERGKITCIEITVLAPDEPFVRGKTSGASTVRNFVERQTRRALRKALKTLDPSTFDAQSDSQSDESSEQDTRIPIAVHTSEPTSHISRLYILIVAHTSTGFRIGQDILLGRDINPKTGKKGKWGQKSHSKGGQQKSDVDVVSDLIDECVQGFMGELVDQLEPDSRHGSDTVSKRRSCLDRHMRDQIVVFEALGNMYRGGTETGSQVQEDERYWTLHTQTAKWVCAEMLGSDGTRGKE
ncbi:uncharacterized protein N7498_010796 [Penicillium cinerascens]|uniref:RNA 3'-terminal phosphate cyclase domain-containing protein n=1 Tax=Penicillium cinerascens TaxID=70096 RepID=A0A9W9J9M2_9EURO|nr:uncharacterized protein N7498_010796 [Penicillium cinerascens]KAJ5191811.1 hypothetical protein N7498_010796 [Penicillium cinerascens]